MSHWTGTLDLVRATLEASAAWIAAVAPAAAADRVVVGVGGHPWDGTFLTVAASKPLALPLAQIGVGPLRLRANGVRRWQRQGLITIDVEMDGPETPTRYRAALQLAENLADAYRAAYDAGTVAMPDIDITGPPLFLPRSMPSPFAGCWVFQISLSWDQNK